MSYNIKCPCGHEVKAKNIVRLLDGHTDDTGALICQSCGERGAHIRRTSELQEIGRIWERWIKAAIPIASRHSTYVPYVFLVSECPDKAPTGVHFNYYKDTRPDGGKLKHGHGPGGAPVLKKSEFLTLILKLGKVEFLTADDLERVASEIRAG